MPRHGVYTQPGAKGVKGLLDWQAWSGTTVHQMLDFTEKLTWKHITSWLPWDAWSQLPKMGVRLELTVVMLPDDPTTTLDACAAGAYNVHWDTLGRNLVKYGLAGTVIRPGHEFNGWQYRWTTRAKDPAIAAALREQYAEAFRQIVTTMRNVPGQAFTTSWCLMDRIDGKTDYTQAYPGDECVDYITLDPYDVDPSTRHYPYRSLDKSDPTRPPTEVEIRKAQDAVWAQTLNAPGGLNQWAAFARAHGKRVAIDEYGLTWRSDGYGGNDNPHYIDGILNWAHGADAAWVNYFEIDVPGRAHCLSRTDTLFPRSAERYLARVGELARQ